MSSFDESVDFVSTILDENDDFKHYVSQSKAYVETHSKKGKKKKKKGKKDKDIEKVPSILDILDEKIDSQYKEIVTDVEDIQYMIYQADKKKRKKQKKKMKKGKVCFYEPYSVKAREKAVFRITSSEIIEGIRSIIENFKPLAILLCRLVKLIICTILSIPVVKEKIGVEGLKKIQAVYTMCGAIN